MKKEVDKAVGAWYNSNVPPVRRAPCKLNNVTKRKHQTVSGLVRNHEDATEKLPLSRGLVNYPKEATIKNEAMTNSSMIG